MLQSWSIPAARRKGRNVRVEWLHFHFFISDLVLQFVTCKTCCRFISGYGVDHLKAPKRKPNLTKAPPGNGTQDFIGDYNDAADYAVVQDGYRSISIVPTLILPYSMTFTSCDDCDDMWRHVWRATCWFWQWSMAKRQRWAILSNLSHYS